MKGTKETARPAGKQSAPEKTATHTLPAGQVAVNTLAEKITTKRAKRLATTPASYRKLFERSYVGKVSPRTAIKCFCLECIGFERAAITECVAYACPLWHLRPYQSRKERS